MVCPSWGSAAGLPTRSSSTSSSQKPITLSPKWIVMPLPTHSLSGRSALSHSRGVSMVPAARTTVLADTCSVSPDQVSRNSTPVAPGLPPSERSTRTSVTNAFGRMVTLPVFSASGTTPIAAVRFAFSS
ncbi:hypothetical protein BRC63_09680 [Halobacteriales archaeon QH_10_70_21]|nr:MAG: hypothetical protein BRC63_09680 [Halobacteriales archaeon QH_10_70_21]